MRVFELFIQSEKITGNDWYRLTEKIGEYEKYFSLEIRFDANTIEFYLFSHKDLAVLKTKLHGFLLIPIRKAPIEKTGAKQPRFIALKRKHILELKEEEEIKRQRTIKNITVEYNCILFITFYKVMIFLEDIRGNTFYSSYYVLHNPLKNFDFDFTKNSKIKKKSTPLFLILPTETAKLFTLFKNEGFLEIFTPPAFSSP